ncbi:Zinc finger protein, partial [Pseudolycoriella hygida]
MDKCGTIYRRTADSFIYVCYHCGSAFADIDYTLQHIESHFQLVQVTVEENPLRCEYKNSENIDQDNGPDITELDVDIKAEITEVENCVENYTEKVDNFDCQRCDSVFLSKFSFRCHLFKEHFNAQTLECGKCRKKFKRNASFESHLRQHIEKGEVSWGSEGDGILEPSANDVVSTRHSDNFSPSLEVEPQLEKPKKKKRNKTGKTRSKQMTRQLSTYVCHKCSETFVQAQDLSDHLTTHPTDDLLQVNKCKECNFYFGTPFHLRVHVLESHLKAKHFKCSTCKVEFKKEEKSLFEKHLEAHLDDNSAKWKDKRDGILQDANEEVTYAASLEDITIQSTELTCEQCEEKFILKSNLDEHCRCMHAESERELRCPQCDCVFYKLRMYFAHQLEHRRVGEKVIETDETVLVNNLNAFIDQQFVFNAAENDPNPYKCQICPVQKNDSFEIRRHVREGHVYRTLQQPLTPHLKKTFSCNICGMVIKRSSFRSHLMTHTDIKLFACSTCGKKFRNNFTKMTHERLHTGE